MSSDYECDDYDDCGDNSDEQGCGSGMFVYSIMCHTLTLSTPPYTVEAGFVQWGGRTGSRGSNFC